VEAASECLAHICREGLSRTGLWLRRSAPPTNGDWALPVLSRIDPSAAIPIWRTRRLRLQGYPWDRVQVDLELLRLGDRQAIRAVVGFLQNPPSLENREAWFAGLALASAQELARLDYRPAAVILRRLRDRGYLSDPIVEVLIAQLIRDIGGLKRLTREPDTAPAALDALVRLEAVDALKEIAHDRSHPFRAEAKARLKHLRATRASSRH
jgi:hypothetical protein